MPYIADRDQRDRIETLLHDAYRIGPIDSEGALNFAVTTLCDIYLGEEGPVNYSRLNTIIGVLECAKLELYRRIVVPYENQKLAENGDVYLTDVGGWYTESTGGNHE